MTAVDKKDGMKFLQTQIASDISDILLLRMIPFNFLIVFMFGDHVQDTRTRGRK